MNGHDRELLRELAENACAEMDELLQMRLREAHEWRMTLPSIEGPLGQEYEKTARQMHAAHEATLRQLIEMGKHRIRSRFNRVL